MVSDRFARAARMTAIFALAFCLALPLAQAGLNDDWHRPRETVTIVAAADALPDEAADAYESLAKEYGLKVVRRDAADPAQALAAIQASRGILAVFAHGVHDGARFGDATLSWADLAQAAQGSRAKAILLIGCYSKIAADLLTKPTFGYEGEVDAKLAGFDAFEHTIYKLHGDAVPLEAERILWSAIERATQSDPQFGLRILQPIDPLSHETGHSSNHHTKGDEYSYEQEIKGQSSAGVKLDPFNLRFKKAYCGEDQIPCGWHADTFLKFDLFNKCKTLFSLTRVALPGIGLAIEEFVKRMGGQGDLLALKLCGLIWFGFGNSGAFGGGQLSLRLGVFFEMPKRWFKNLGIQAYVSAGVQAGAKDRGDDRHADVNVQPYVDWAFEVRLWYIKLDYRDILAKYDIPIQVCWRCMIENMQNGPDAQQQEVSYGTPTVRVGAPVGRDLVKSGAAERLGIPAGTDITTLRFNLDHPVARDVFLAEEPAGAEGNCEGVEDSSITLDGESDLAMYGAQACPDDPSSARAIVGVGNAESSPIGGSNLGGDAWTVADAVGGELFDDVTALYGTAYQTPSSLALAIGEKAEAYAKKLALEESMPVRIPPQADCIFKVIPPGAPGGPDFKNGDCWPLREDGTPRFDLTKPLANDFVKTGAFNFDHHMTTAQAQQLYSAGIALGGGAIKTRDPVLVGGTGCDGIFERWGCA